MSKVIYRPNIIHFEESIKAQKEVSSLDEIFNMPENRIYKSARVKIEPYYVVHDVNRRMKDRRTSNFNGKVVYWEGSQVILSILDGNTDILGFINKAF